MNVRFAFGSLLTLLATACGDAGSSAPPAPSSTGGAGRVVSTSGAPSASAAPVTTATTTSTGSPPAPVAEAGVDAGASMSSGDAGAAVDICSITGGIGAPLYGPMDATEPDCASQCALLADTHPNRSCMWGTRDITPTGTCVVVGGAGASLYGPQTQTEGQCYDQCTMFQVTNVNLDCSWMGANGSVDITPEDTCTIADGVTAPVFGPMVDRRGLCLDACLAAVSSRPSCTCTWGSVNLRE